MAVRRSWHRAVRGSGPRERFARATPAGGGTADAAERFRQRHVRLGVWLSLATILEVTGYLWLGHPHADPAPLLLLSAFAAVVNGGLWARATSVARLRFHSVFFVAWSGGTTVLILVGVALDGGERSPLTVLLFLPMLYAAQAYPPRGALLLGAEGVLWFGLVCSTDATTSHASTALMAGTLALATVMAAMSARNREQQARELLALTALLEADANHDGLTRCVNRRGFDAALSVEVARAMRHARPLSLLLLDVDHLKAINDLRGHSAGDVALRLVGSTLQRYGRREDLAARLGGDEFALLAPDLPEAAAIALADRLHAALREQTAAAPVSVSIGVAGLTSDITTPADLLRAADAAMYAAKTAGRNRTVCLDQVSNTEAAPA